MMPFFDLSKYENHETFHDSHFFNDPCENAWIRRENELNAQFKEDVIRHVGLHDHPKREMIWEYVHNQFIGQDFSPLQVNLPVQRSSIVDGRTCSSAWCKLRLPMV